MARESFLMYLSFEELLMRLTPDELRLMMLAIFRYHRGGELPDFGDNRVLDMCWQSLKSDFDRDSEKYNAVCERNRKNGMRGGRPAKTQKNPKNPLGFDKTQENPKEPKKPDTDTDTDTDTDILPSKAGNITARACDALGEQVFNRFKAWLETWQSIHGEGKAMPKHTQDAQIQTLLHLPPEIRLDAVNAAIKGCWKNICDIRHDSSSAKSTPAQQRREMVNGSKGGW